MFVNHRKKAQLVIALVFLLGIFTGGLAVHLFYAQQALPANSVAEVTNELSARVGLDLAQREQAEVILNESRSQYRQVREQMQPHYQTVRDNTRSKIRAILSDQQRLKFDQWVHELDEKRPQKAKSQTESK